MTSRWCYGHHHNTEEDSKPVPQTTAIYFKTLHATFSKRPSWLYGDIFGAIASSQLLHHGIL